MKRKFDRRRRRRRSQMNPRRAVRMNVRIAGKGGFRL